MTDGKGGQRKHNRGFSREMNHKQGSIYRNPEERTPIHFRTDSGANRLEDRLPKAADVEAVALPLHAFSLTQGVPKLQ